tara:strand:- start:323 stop:574 length:252 start_codon:yes stop_codon:yes gene_type:complete
LGKSDEKPKKFKKTSKKLIKEAEDPCLVCDGDLYIDGEFTQRIGLINEMDEVYGWLCPYCKTEFDMEGKIESLNGKNNISGIA